MHWISFLLGVIVGACLGSAAIVAQFSKGSKAPLWRSIAVRTGALAAGVPALLVGALAVAITSRFDVGGVAAAVGAVPGLLFLLRGQRRAAAIASGDPAAVNARLEDLRRKQPPPGESSLPFEISAISSAKGFLRIGRLDATAQALELLHWPALEGEMLVVAASLLAEAYLFSGLPERARAALKRAEEAVDEFGDRDATTVLHARILAHEGSAAKALRRRDALEEIGSRRPDLSAQVAIALAHAEAGAGDEAKARAHAQRLGKLVPNGLDALIRPEGPATMLARELSRSSAYR